MNYFHTLLLASLAAMAHPSMAQQDAQRVLPPGPSSDVVRTASGVWRDGTDYVAAGADYRARVGTRSMTIVPALGRTVPHELPFRLELASIHSGSDMLLGKPDPSTPRLEQDVVMLARGDGISERYQMRPDGCELSFRFRSRPRAAGDLVVRLAVTTDLVPDALGAQPDGVVYRHGDAGGIRVGGVTALMRPALHAAVACASRRADWSCRCRDPGSRRLSIR